MSLLTNLKYALKAVCNVHRPGDQPNIFLLATPRGGSTWVMELFASQPGMKCYDEPLNVRRDNVARVGLFRDWQSVMPDTGDPEQVLGFLRDLVAGRHRCMNPAPFRPHHRVFTNRIVFKLHEIEHLIDRLGEVCNAQILYLLRHPIPTTQSRRVFPRLDLFLSSRYYDALIDDRRRLDEIKAIARRGNHLEQGVISWCYENIIPLCQPRFQGLVVTYEELVLNPIRSCELLLQHFHLRDRAAMLRAFSRPAANIAMSPQETQAAMRNGDDQQRRQYLVSKWVAKVSSRDMATVTSIMALFGLDVYSGDRCLSHPRYLHFEDTAQLAPAQTV